MKIKPDIFPDHSTFWHIEGIYDWVEAFESISDSKSWLNGQLAERLFEFL